MKKLLGVVALAVAGTGCQLNKTTDKVSVETSAPAELAANTAVDTLSVAMLKGYDLSPVLRTLPADPNTIVEPMNGFFGTDHYRIELVVTDVKRDPQQPARYLLRGKDRYKGRVIPFAGTIELTRVQRQPISLKGALEAAYTALGHFKLMEDATYPKAGTFQGLVAVDWAVEKSGEVRQFTPSVRIPHSEGRIREFEPSTKTPTLGGGILYEGTWTSATGQMKPAVWAADLLAYHGPQVLSDFAVGGRMLSVNPKYAKLGWNEYWQNDEWWADSPQPSLNL
jgi:hypothetical protein